MDDVLVLVRLGLAAVFVVAAVGKLLDRSGSRQALRDFGVPERGISAGVVLLPLAELAVAAALVFAPTARLGAVGALVLLGAFALGVSRVLKQGQAPDCHCFGQLSSQPVSKATLVRNVALAVPAALVAVQGNGPAIDDWVRSHDGQELALLGTSVLAGALAAATALLWRENRRLRANQAWTPPSPLRVGARAPEFNLPATDGGMVSLPSLLGSEHPLVLIFVQPGCGPCVELMPNLARWQGTLGHELSLVVVTGGDREEGQRLEEEHGLSSVLADGASASAAYRVAGTPTALVVRADGTVGSAPAAGAAAIEALVRLSLHPERSTGVLEIHQVA